MNYSNKKSALNGLVPTIRERKIVGINLNFIDKTSVLASVSAGFLNEKSDGRVHAILAKLANA